MKFALQSLKRLPLLMVSVFLLTGCGDYFASYFENDAPINNAPVAQNTTTTLTKNSTANITFVASDSDGDALVYIVTQFPEHGALSGSLPNLTYTPAADFSGTDTLKFRANDGKVDSNEVTITLTVKGSDAPPTNHAPVAQNSRITLQENTSKGITLIASDSDGDALTYTITQYPAHGGLNGTLPNPTYTPAANFTGTDTIKFRVNDGKANSDEATVTLTVNAITPPDNHAPVAQNAGISLKQDTAKSFTISASDSDGDSLTYTVTHTPAHGKLSGTAPNLTYTPAADFSGTDTLKFRANDGKVDSNEATITLMVKGPDTPPTNHAPVAQNSRITLQENTSHLFSNHHPNHA